VFLLTFIVLPFVVVSVFHSHAHVALRFVCLFVCLFVWDVRVDIRWDKEERKMYLGRSMRVVDSIQHRLAYYLCATSPFMAD